jgi:hypothetical protein
MTAVLYAPVVVTLEHMVDAQHTLLSTLAYVGLAVLATTAAAMGLVPFPLTWERIAEGER